LISSYDYLLLNLIKVINLLTIFIIIFIIRELSKTKISLKNKIFKVQNSNLENRIYKPLPPSVIIKESDIHELGLFAKENI